ncbi:MAG TPA: GAF domain-containing protein, partial [Ktedonobacterales bacterium]|nr:GAF domain-containing protein [Ktedonobacterales bacterium]
MPLEQEPTNAATISIRDQRTVHIRDASAEGGLSAVARSMGVQSGIAVPLIRAGDAVGCIALTEMRLGGYSDSQIELLKTFAEQAVIAITSAETYRALQERTAALAQRNSEYGERIEQQTATIDVLRVMSSSPGDPQQVFDQIAERARSFCEAEFGALTLVEDDCVRVHALVGNEAFVEQVRALYPAPIDWSVAGPFSEIQMELLQTSAEQAVIAITSAETYRALQARTSDLQESLERQQAIAEILQVINHSPGELQPVFDALLDRVMRLCGAAFGILAVQDTAHARTVAAHGLPPALAEWRQNHPVINAKNTLLARVMAGEPYVHSIDLKDDDLYRRGEPLRRANVDLGGARTSLYVPLKRDHEVLGTIHIYRQEVRPFTDKQIALLQTFAAQAVIAME